MSPKFSVSLARRSGIVPKSREEQLEILKQFKDSQEELERVCKEKGIPVPIMVC